MLSRRTRHVALAVPLAVACGAWTVQLATDDVSAQTDPTASAPVEVPSEVPAPVSPPVSGLGGAIEAPANYSQPDPRSRDLEPAIRTVLASANSGTIPSSALAAYQRAESVINAADTSCHLTWQMIAAIGRVESDHGRTGGNLLDADGVARPGILGLPLDGTNGTSKIRDTDAGELDGDTRFDRAVGPMQFIPSTWAVVGVDADNDGIRNPQDIDDAALATAVYLCSGDDDLSTVAGQRNAVHRYNHSDSYVDMVVALADRYLTTGLATTFGSTVSAGYVTPVDVSEQATSKPRDTSTADERPGRGSKFASTDDDKGGKGSDKAPQGNGWASPWGDGATADPVEHHGGHHGGHGGGHGQGDDTDGTDGPLDPTLPVDPTEPTDPTEPSDPTGTPTDGQPDDGQPDDGQQDDGQQDEPTTPDDGQGQGQDDGEQGGQDEQGAPATPSVPDAPATPTVPAVLSLADALVQCATVGWVDDPARDAATDPDDFDMCVISATETGEVPDPADGLLVPAPAATKP